MNRDWDEFDPEAREAREIGREMVDKSTGLGSVAVHFYRGKWRWFLPGANASMRQSTGP